VEKQMNGDQTLVQDILDMAKRPDSFSKPQLATRGDAPCGGD